MIQMHRKIIYFLQQYIHQEKNCPYGKFCMCLLTEKKTECATHLNSQAL